MPENKISTGKELRVRIPVPEELAYLGTLLDYRVNRRSGLGSFLGWLLTYLFKDLPSEKVITFALARAADYALLLDGVISEFVSTEELLEKVRALRVEIEGDSQPIDSGQSDHPEESETSSSDQIPDLEDVVWD